MADLGQGVWLQMKIYRSVLSALLTNSPLSFNEFLHAKFIGIGSGGQPGHVTPQ